MSKEKLNELDGKQISEREQEFSYSRNGLIPGWGEVVEEFRLKEFHPRDFGLLKDYYRAQRRVAQKRHKKAKAVFDGLDKNPDFLNLEQREESLLTGIAFFVRRGSEKRGG